MEKKLDVILMAHLQVLEIIHETISNAVEVTEALKAATRNTLQEVIVDLGKRYSLTAHHEQLRQAISCWIMKIQRYVMD